MHAEDTRATSFYRQSISNPAWIVVLGAIESKSGSTSIDHAAALPNAMFFHDSQ